MNLSEPTPGSFSLLHACMWHGHKRCTVPQGDEPGCAPSQPAGRGHVAIDVRTAYELGANLKVSGSASPLLQVAVLMPWHTTDTGEKLGGCRPGCLLRLASGWAHK